MNRILLLTAFSIFCNTGYIFAQSPVAIPSAYKSVNGINYVRTWDVLAPVTSSSEITTGSPVTSARMTTQYLDGLGRPLQTVVKQGSLITDPANPTSAANSKDLVTASTYDNFGREQYQYLPFVASTTGNNTAVTNGLFKLNPFQQQVAFYNKHFYFDDPTEVNIGTSNLNWAYSKTEFEESPLGRAKKSLSPGAGWVGSNRGVAVKSWFNTSVDDVRMWGVTNATTEGDWGSYATSVSYPAGQLIKTVSEDEHGKQVIEFSAKDGLLILKKVQNGLLTETTGAGSNHSEWMCTYYIYDSRNRLRGVIQPEAVKLMATSANWDVTSYLNEQCFRYEYDGRGRMIRKKVPGAGDVYMVYDKRDRVVLTQDANLRGSSPSKWMYIKYDQLNRPVATGVWDNSSTRSTHAASAANTDDYPSLTSGTYEELTVTFYDNYNWVDVHTASGFSKEISTLDNTHLLTPSSNFPYPEAVQQSKSVNGLPTGTKVKVLGEDTYLYTITYYDRQGRVIQVQSKNYSGGTDIITTQYTFSGAPLLTVTRNVKSGTGALTHITVTENVYDELLRVVEVKKKVQNSLLTPNVMSASKTLLKLQYNALGQVKKKLLGNKKDINGNYTTTPLEEITQDYNVRGWMIGANREFAIGSSTNTNNYFGYDLGFDKTAIIHSDANIGSYANAAYNGNIAGTVWRSRGDMQIRKYDFSYDASNRLTAATFNQNTGGSAWSNAEVNFSVENLTYDYNGNIITMKQWGMKLQGKEVIDDLVYSYYTNSNKLKSVLDYQTTAQNLGDFTDKNTGCDDYGYDLNGNLITDRNKKIHGSTATTGVDLTSPGGIVYNFLNLPKEIKVQKDDLSGEKGTIEYVYDATGAKLKKVVKEGGVVKGTTLYLGGAIYKDDIPELFGHEEGRLRFIPQNGNTPARLEYDYFLKDHLGNIRMVLTEEKRQDVYHPATLEGSLTTDGSPNAAFKEKDFYTIESSNIVAKSSLVADYPNHNGAPPYNYNANSVTAANSQKVYKLQGSATTGEGATGLGITLKVMGGDKIDIFGKSYWIDQGTPSNYSIPTLNIFSGVLGAPGSPATSKGSASTINGISPIAALVNSFLSDPNRSTTGSNIPKAYINWILFDENFKMVGGSFDKVSDNGSEVKSHAVTGINVPKNGYLYVYASNESSVSAYFDNLQVIHTRDHILEETHYYPFGLVQKWISTKAAGTIENRKKFNGIEHTTELDMNQYDAFYRNADPQIGRWWQIDPKPNMGESPYAMMGNNPILNTDFLGDTIKVRTGFLGLRKLRYDEISKKLYKKNGSEYTGNNKFAGKSIEYLNKMGASPAGSKVLSRMSKAPADFVLKNKTPKNGAAASFTPKGEGGKMHVGILMSGRTDRQKLGSFSHEMFHGYQQLNGSQLGTINSEVEAYLFQYGIEKSAGYQIGNLGYNSHWGQAYNASMQSLLTSSTFNQSDFNSAVENFLPGATINARYHGLGVGRYENLPMINNYDPSIDQVYPLQRL